MEGSNNAAMWQDALHQTILELEAKTERYRSYCEKFHQTAAIVNKRTIELKGENKKLNGQVQLLTQDLCFMESKNEELHLFAMEDKKYHNREMEAKQQQLQRMEKQLQDQRAITCVWKEATEKLVRHEEEQEHKI